MLTNKQAFTLIELLVVVLIIGILAAVAVPQYQTVVLKARYATIKNMTKSLAEAQVLYYLANNQYTTNIADLDISKNENDIFCILSTDAVQCYTQDRKMSYRIYLPFTEHSAWQAICFANKDNDSSASNRREKACKNETKRLTPSTSNDSYSSWYY